VDALRAKEAALAPAREKIRGLETDLGDWRLLSDATGKDGIPQLRIDAAGPEVSATATEILRVIWGTRFAISIETQTETLDGKAVEDFEIVIHDGAERRTVEDLSGGERVAVHRAISLAASIYCRNRSGIDWETLCLDEADGALDRDNARHYVPMLRKAREIGRFHQIIIISQRAEVISAADVVVNVSEGVLTVEGAAAREAA
jgi:DNA repair exonuclease SbcCD ATPase subunit